MIVVVHGHTLSTASDPLSNSALRKAAMAALDVLAEDPAFMSRVCDCRTKRQDKKAQMKQAKKGGNPKDKSGKTTPDIETGGQKAGRASRSRDDSEDDTMDIVDDTPQ